MYIVTTPSALENLNFTQEMYLFFLRHVYNNYTIYPEKLHILHKHAPKCHVHANWSFHRKDLCDARVKLEMSSYFQMKCPAQVYPPADQEQGTFKFTATVKVTFKFTATARVTFKFTASHLQVYPQQVTSSGQTQNDFIFLDEVFIQ